MNLTSVTYTSLAQPDLQSSELEAIYRNSRENNARAEITGLLIYNGTHFLQIVEGAGAAIETLIERIRGDGRHKGFEIRDKRRVDARSFPDWSMELLRVTPGFFQARAAIAETLPTTVPEVIRGRLLRMTELISTIEFPS
jgi:Sensors of blue-light using FAD